jgi:hypothetical protein
VRFPDGGLSSVVYIGEVGQHGFQLRGTGFLIQIERDSGPLYYLVTAQHVIRRMKKPNQFTIYVNNAKGEGRILRNKGIHKWWTHPTDNTVDAAVFPWGLATKNYPYRLFKAEAFLTPELAIARRIGVGDEVYVVGLFRPQSGKTRITPMVRTGHIAMMAHERTATENYGDALMHLIEAFSLKGFSGAPVYVHETVTIPVHPNRPGDPPYLSGVGNFFLLGLLHGILYVPVDKELTGQVIDPNQMWHTGISQVVPADQILDILNQPKLLEYEKMIEKTLKNTPPMETAIEDEEPTNKVKRKNRDVQIPPIGRDKLFNALKKAAQRQKPS